MTILQTINASASPEVQQNENIETLSAAGIFGKRQPVTSGLTWGYYGGLYNGNTIADGTVTLTNTTTNYVVVKRQDGVVSVATTLTNWNNISDYARLYQLTTAGGVVTVTVDARMDSGGLLKGAAARNNFSVAAQTPAAATRTYIVGSAIAVPVSKLQIGTMLRWRFSMTKTAAGVAASTFDICFGTAGTTVDTARVSFTKPAGTAAADEGWVDIYATVRGPLSGSGIVVGQFNLIHNLQNTGHALIPCVSVNTISAAFDVTVANLIAGLCITSGASDVLTIQLVQAEALNLGW